jgi:hypothetical protein
MSEWFMELVLKTSDPKGPGVRIPLSPPITLSPAIKPSKLNIRPQASILFATRRSTQVVEGDGLLNR